MMLPTKTFMGVPHLHAQSVVLVENKLSTTLPTVMLPTEVMYDEIEIVFLLGGGSVVVYEPISEEEGLPPQKFAKSIYSRSGGDILHGIDGDDEGDCGYFSARQYTLSAFTPSNKIKLKRGELFSLQLNGCTTCVIICSGDKSSKPVTILEPIVDGNVVPLAMGGTFNDF